MSEQITHTLTPKQQAHVAALMAEAESFAKRVEEINYGVRSFLAYVVSEAELPVVEGGWSLSQDRTMLIGEKNEGESK